MINLPLTSYLFVVLVMVGSAIGLVLSRTPRGVRSLRRTYCDESLPMMLRNAAAVMPLWATSWFFIGLLLFLPRWLAVWVVVFALVVMEIAFVLSYRVPAPFLPRWLRDEIEQGITPVARPDRMDWLLFAMVVALSIAGDISLVILIVVFHGGSSGA